MKARFKKNICVCLSSVKDLIILSTRESFRLCFAKQWLFALNQLKLRFNLSSWKSLGIITFKYMNMLVNRCAVCWNWHIHAFPKTASSLNRANVCKRKWKCSSVVFRSTPTFSHRNVCNPLFAGILEMFTFSVRIPVSRYQQTDRPISRAACNVK